MKYIFFNFLFDIKRNLRAECDNEHLMQTQKRLKVLECVFSSDFCQLDIYYVWLLLTGLEKFVFMSSLTLRQVALTFCSPWASLLFYWFSWQMICLVPCPLSMKSYLPKGKNLHVLVLDKWTGLFLSHVHICTCPIQNTADTHKCPYLKNSYYYHFVSIMEHFAG